MVFARFLVIMRLMVGKKPKTNRRLNWLMAMPVFLGFLISGLFYRQMPGVIVSGWDRFGQPNGYLPRFWGLFLMPLTSLIMLVLLWLIPQADPLKKNVDKFRSHFDNFIVFILFFLLYLHLLVLAWALGYRFNMVYALILPLAILFWLVGVLLEKSRRNWFIGIKTPWTISSDLVWEKTHRLGGRLFRVAGIIVLGGFLLPDFSFWLAIIPPLLLSVFLTAYSYCWYRKGVGVN